MLCHGDAESSMHDCTVLVRLHCRPFSFYSCIVTLFCWGNAKDSSMLLVIYVADAECQQICESAVSGVHATTQQSP
jgi:hypothetical protein